MSEPLTYGELMMLCEGHGASAIYERHQEIANDLHAQITLKDKQILQQCLTIKAV